MMQSAVVIGCRHCENAFANMHKRAGTNELKEHFPFTTAFIKEELEQLLQFYTCPFCENALYISPSIIGFINRFFDKDYHIHIEGQLLEFASSSISLTIPVNQEKEKTKDILDKLGLYNLMQSSDLPTVDEIQIIQEAAKQIDRTRWYLRLESSHVCESFSGVDPDDFGLEDL